jgi:hypothetical protein
MLRLPHALLALAALCLGFLAQPAAAAVIQLEGTNVNGVQADWSRSDVPKSPSLDGDSIWGTDGFYLFQALPDTDDNTSTDAFENVDQSPPSYAALTPFGANGSTHDDTYALINDWADPFNTNLPSGTAYRTGVAASTETELFRITFNLETDPTYIYYIGILHDNAVIADAPTHLRLAGASGDSGSISLAAADGFIDYTFFRVTGLNNGDVLTLFGTRGSGTGNVGIGGILFDSAPIPEPSTWLLLGCGLGALAWCHRCRRQP